jgi:hypothetical protein
MIELGKCLKIFFGEGSRADTRRTPKEERKFEVVWVEGLQEKIVKSVSKSCQWYLETTDGHGIIYHTGDEILSRLKPGDRVRINAFDELRTEYGDVDCFDLD